MALILNALHITITKHSAFVYGMHLDYHFFIYLHNLLKKQFVSFVKTCLFLLFTFCMLRPQIYFYNFNICQIKLLNLMVCAYLFKYMLYKLVLNNFMLILLWFTKLGTILYCFFLFLYHMFLYSPRMHVTIGLHLCHTFLF